MTHSQPLHMLSVLTKWGLTSRNSIPPSFTRCHEYWNVFHRTSCGAGEGPVALQPAGLSINAELSSTPRFSIFHRQRFRCYYPSSKQRDNVPASARLVNFFPVVVWSISSCEVTRSAGCSHFLCVCITLVCCNLSDCLANKTLYFAALNRVPYHDRYHNHGWS